MCKTNQGCFTTTENSKYISLAQCRKGVRTMGLPIHLHPFGTEQATSKAFSWSSSQLRNKYGMSATLALTLQL